MRQRYQKQIISRYPPLCDFLFRYTAANEKNWKPSHAVGQRVGINRFNEWLLASHANLNELYIVESPDISKLVQAV